MGDDIVAVEAAIAKVASEIASVESEISSVQAAIDRVEKQLEREDLAENDVTYWRGKENKLRDKEDKLRDEKNKLRDKEDKLRDEKNKLRDEKNKLRDERFQGRPPLHPDSPKGKTGVDVERKLDNILEALAQRDRATPQYSPAQIGKQEKDRLESEGTFTVFVEKETEDAMLSAEEAAELAKLENEHQVVAYLTPHLENLVHSIATVNYSVFNSEQYKWIETSNETSQFNQKPDLIICDPAFIDAKPPFKISEDPALQDIRRDTFRYGILSRWKLRDFIGITCEAKQSIDNQAFGEVINYGTHICFGDHGSVTTRLLLFDKEQFWLVHVVRGTVAMVTTCQWLDRGSKNLLRDFIRQPALPKLLKLACQQFQLIVGTDSFLGAGAFGYVFRALRQDGRCVALKLVLRNDDGSVPRLEQETEKMRIAHEKCPSEVMGVENEGFVAFDNGAVLLMSKVGEPYSNLDPQSIVDSLRTLHKNNIIHGDARLDNVVCIDKKPCWIDFMDASFICGIVSKDAELKKLVEDVRERFQYNPSL